MCHYIKFLYQDILQVAWFPSSTGHMHYTYCSRVSSTPLYAFCSYTSLLWANFMPFHVS